MSHPREEVAAAFAEFSRRGAEARDWPAWADLFTDDALYIEHNLGTFHGRDEIKAWIVSTMADHKAMTFEIPWSMIDGDRVAFYIWNLLPDPAGGSAEYKFPNSTVIHYAGDGRWSYEEDYYNPADAARVFTEWFTAGGRRDTPADPSLRGVVDWSPEPVATIHPREEVDAEFHRYVERARHAVATGDWEQWADQFTEDARYREHHFGTFAGRAAIKEWITGVMRPFPQMEFPVDWYMIDGNRVSQRSIQRLPDPAGGDAKFEWPVHVILHYAGGGKWSYEEDVYNPAEGVAIVTAWMEAGGELPPEALAMLG
jgi:predicted SnoaL-like aldol condensation-catalyzing enzyme